MLEVKNIAKAYGRKQVLEDVSFNIEPGKITYLVGENGAGKSTIMNIIMKLTPASAGQVLLDGQPVTVNDFNRIAYIPDKIIVLQGMKVIEAIEYMDTYYQAFNLKKADELLAFFRLDANQAIGKLSKGNQAKLNLLLGLAMDTDYILLDEPFSGIDVLAREEISQVFTDKLIEGRGALVSTHDLADIEFLVDTVVMLDQGRIVRSFEPEQVRQETGQSITDIMREVYLND